MLLKRDALHWYQYDVSFSIDLLTSFVQGIEKQAAESILDYRTTKAEGGHQGLDEDSFDLKEIFEEYFPTLQRRSALLTIWGLLEHELESLCVLYKSEQGFELAASDLRGTGIDRSTTYLEKVAGLKGLKASEEWEYLKAVQTIRNVFAHGDGKTIDSKGKPKAEVLAAMKTVGFLSGEEEIVVPVGFLSKVVATCDGFFRLIDASVKAKENPNIATRKIGQD